MPCMRQCGLTIGVLAVLYVILLGSFGSRSLTTMKYPAITLMSSIHLREVFEAAGCLYDRHLVFYAVCTCDCVFVLCTGTGTETAEKKIRIKMVSLWGDGCRFRGGKNAPQKQPWGNGSGIICCISESRCFVPAIVCTFVGKGKNGMKGKIKKYVALVLSVQQLLCGCNCHRTRKSLFSMMAVVDEKDGQISFGYGFPKLKAKEG